jgi:sulfur-oxidizing protein SoxY
LNPGTAAVKATSPEISRYLELGFGMTEKQLLPMSLSRRTFIGKGTSIGLLAVAWAAGLVTPSMLRASVLKDAFAAKTSDQAARILAGELKINPSKEILLNIPRTAENGANVPVTISSNLEGIQSIAIIAEKNPVPLVGLFRLANDTEIYLQARLKLASSSHVTVLANTVDQILSSRQYVKVTVGSCGP